MGFLVLFAGAGPVPATLMPASDIGLCVVPSTLISSLVLIISSILSEEKPMSLKSSRISASLRGATCVPHLAGFLSSLSIFLRSSSSRVEVFLVCGCLVEEASPAAGMVDDVLLLPVVLAVVAEVVFFAEALRPGFLRFVFFGLALFGSEAFTVGSRGDALFASGEVLSPTTAVELERVVESAGASLVASRLSVLVFAAASAGEREEVELLVEDMVSRWVMW